METGRPKRLSKNVVPKPTRMPYINFVQAFRNTYQGSPVTSKDMVRMAAKAWNKLSESEKRPYVELAEVERAKPRRQPKKLKRLVRRRNSSEFSFY